MSVNARIVVFPPVLACNGGGYDDSMYGEEFVDTSGRQEAADMVVD